MFNFDDEMEDDDQMEDDRDLEAQINAQIQKDQFLLEKEQFKKQLLGLGLQSVAQVK